MDANSLVIAVGTDHTKNLRLVRFAENLARKGGLTIRLLHVHEPAATSEELAAASVGPRIYAERTIHDAEGSEIAAARERLRLLAACVASDLRVIHDVAVGEVVDCVKSYTGGSR